MFALKKTKFITQTKSGELLQKMTTKAFSSINQENVNNVRQPICQTPSVSSEPRLKLFAVFVMVLSFVKYSKIC